MCGCVCDCFMDVLRDFCRIRTYLVFKVSKESDRIRYHCAVHPEDMDSTFTY